jgi:hypothetical protein
MEFICKNLIFVGCLGEGVLAKRKVLLLDSKNSSIMFMELEEAIETKEYC